MKGIIKLEGKERLTLMRELQGCKYFVEDYEDRMPGARDFVEHSKALYSVLADILNMDIKASEAIPRKIWDKL